ncbi:hypothetical protein ACFL3G_09635 [Planctomycetota bacterium]
MAKSVAGGGFMGACLDRLLGLLKGEFYIQSTLAGVGFISYNFIKVVSV